MVWEPSKDGCEPHCSSSISAGGSTKGISTLVSIFDTVHELRRSSIHAGGAVLVRELSEEHKAADRAAVLDSPDFATVLDFLEVYFGLNRI